MPLLICCEPVSYTHLDVYKRQEERLPEAEAAVTQIRVDIPVDTEAIRVVPWQEVLKQEMSDRLK